MRKVSVTSLPDNLGMINLVEKSAGQASGKAASNISTMLQDVCAVHSSNLSWVSDSSFSPSRLPWPLCPCQMLFLLLLVFQLVKSLRLAAPGGELETKIHLGTCSAYLLHSTSEGQLCITFCFPALFRPCCIQIPECC